MEDLPGSSALSPEFSDFEDFEEVCPKPKKRKVSEPEEPEEPQSDNKVRSKFWCLTGYRTQMRQDQMASILHGKLTRIKFYALGPTEISSEKKSHYHAIVVFHKSQRKSVFGPEILMSSWNKPLQIMGERKNMKAALQSYMTYCTKEGSWDKQYGDMPIFSKEQDEKRKTSRTEIIMKLVKEGKKKSEILDMYPGSLQTIVRLMGERRPRQHETKCMYIYGPAGTGKTTAIMNALFAIEDTYPELNFYSKMGGFSKFWDGYDNQPLVVIDDPGIFSSRKPEEIEAFKNVVSRGRMQVEVKFGSMVFDSRLVIISSNATPNQTCESSGIHHYDALMSRINGNRSIFNALHIRDKKEARVGLTTFLIESIIRYLNHELDKDYDYLAVGSALKPHKAPVDLSMMFKPQ